MFNLIDAVVTDLLIEHAQTENMKNARDRLKYFRDNGTIEETGWSNDDYNRQPDTTRYPTPIVPTEAGYPGLEPPVG